METRIARGLALAVLALGSVALAAQEGGRKAPVFDRDANAAFDRALAVAAKKHKRVLLVWGQAQSVGNVELVKMLREGRTEDWPYSYEYVVVPALSGLESRANAELAARVGADRSVVPSVSVVDAAGKSLVQQPVDAWRVDRKWDSDAIGAFLDQHAVEPLDAEVVLASELAFAKKQNKRLIVHLGAPL